MKYYNEKWYYLSTGVNLSDLLIVSNVLYADEYQQQMDEYITLGMKIRCEKVLTKKELERNFKEKVNKNKLDLIKLLPFKTLKKVDLNLLSLGVVTSKDAKVIKKYSKKCKSEINKIDRMYKKACDEYYSFDKFCKNFISYEIKGNDFLLTFECPIKEETSMVVLNNAKVCQNEEFISNAILLKSEVYKNDLGYKVELLVNDNNSIKELSINCDGIKSL